MDLTIIATAYALMWAITGTALVKKLEFEDIVASYIAAIGWPILLPSRLLRKLMK